MAKVYCFDTDQNSQPNVVYHEFVDSQYFVGSLYDEDLLLQYPEEIESTTTKYDKYNFEFRNNWLSLINNTYDRNMAGSKKSIV